MAGVAKHYQCPFCDATHRSDHLTRHILAIHKDIATVMAMPQPEGKSWVRSELNPDVLYHRWVDGTQIKCMKAVCFKCGHLLKKGEGYRKNSTEVFDTHQCKATQARQKAVKVTTEEGATVAVKTTVMALTGEDITKLRFKMPPGAKYCFFESDEDGKVMVRESWVGLSNLAIRLAKEEAERTAAPATENVDAVWAALKKAKPDFFEDDPMSDAEDEDDAPVKQQTVESIVGKVSRLLTGFQKRNANMERIIQDKVARETESLKEELDELTKSNTELNHLVYEKEQSVRSLDRKIQEQERTIQALMAALREKEKEKAKAVTEEKAEAKPKPVQTYRPTLIETIQLV